MKVIDVLSAPERWTQGANARDKDGTAVKHSSAEATCFCLGSAIALAYPEAQWPIFQRIAARTGEPSTIVWNDEPGRTFEEVRRLVIDLDL